MPVSKGQEGVGPLKAPSLTPYEVPDRPCVPPKGVTALPGPRGRDRAREYHAERRPPYTDLGSAVERPYATFNPCRVALYGRNILAPQTGQVPTVPSLAFIILTGRGSFISR